MAFADVALLTERRRMAPRPLPEPVPVPRSVPRADAVGAPIRTVIVHGDAALRDEVAGLLAGDGITVVGAVEGADACPMLGPDVVVVAHRLPGTSAVEVCERLHGEGRAQVVVVAGAPRAVLLRRTIQAGALGFVVADSGADMLRAAVRSVSAGRPFFDPALGRLVVELVARTPVDRRPYGLTRAQLDVVALLPKGLRNREIAAELGITENTVKTHLRHALRKLGVRDRAQAAALVVREGLAY